MNHSSFIDLKIASRLLVTRPFHVICTSDGFVGKRWLMRLIGCIPTRKFMMDVTLVRDMVYAVRELKSSILMFPEASYSFDGTQTPLPESLGKCLKLLKVPVGPDPHQRSVCERSSVQQPAASESEGVRGGGVSAFTGGYREEVPSGIE